MYVYMCLVCGVVYDEAAGWPEEGLAPGTRWAEVPAEWCGQGRLRDERSLMVCPGFFVVA